MSISVSIMDRQITCVTNRLIFTRSNVWLMLVVDMSPEGRRLLCKMLFLPCCYWSCIATNMRRLRCVMAVIDCISASEIVSCTTWHKSGVTRCRAWPYVTKIQRCRHESRHIYKITGQLAIGLHWSDGSKSIKRFIFCPEVANIFCP